MKYVELAVGAILVYNFVLSRFLGICPFLCVSKRISTALEKIYNLFYNNEGSVGWAPGYARDIFVEKRTLMTIDYIEASREEFREMEDSYYIIPTPKFDEAQEQYWAYIFNNLTVYKQI